MAIIWTLFILSLLLPSLIALTLWVFAHRFKRFETFLLAMVMLVLGAWLGHIAFAIAMSESVGLAPDMAMAYVVAASATLGSACGFTVDVYKRGLAGEKREAQDDEPIPIRRGA